MNTLITPVALKPLERAARYEASQPELAKELRAACGNTP